MVPTVILAWSLGKTGSDNFTMARVESKGRFAHRAHVSYRCLTDSVLQVCLDGLIQRQFYFWFLL